VIGVTVTFQYGEDFDHARVVSIAESAHGTFQGMPGLRSKVFTVDDERRRAMNFYGVEPTIDFVEIAQLVENSGASRQE
jgi:hypothetical protein